MDHAKWELWRTPDGEWVAFRLGSQRRVMIRAASPQERADKCEAWEAEHPEDTP